MHEINPFFFEKIKNIVLDSRTRVYRIANSELLQSYWEIGRIIIEEEQSELRAKYGKSTLKNLSQFLTAEFGKGFDESNLRNMRAFFVAFPIRDTLRHELSWSHYRLLSRIEGNERKQFYLNEATYTSRYWIDMYVRMYDDLKRGAGDNPTLEFFYVQRRTKQL